MKFVFGIILLFAAAVGIALIGKLNNGYALIVVPPYRVELSANFLIVLIVLGFVVVYAAARIVSNTLSLPRRVREFHLRRQSDRIRAAIDAALVALLEGRYGRARRQAEKALERGDSSGLSALIGARAALEMRAFAEADRYLSHVEDTSKSLAVSRLMTQAEMALAQQQPHTTLDILAQLKAEAGLHTAALRLELKALQAAQRWADVPPLIEQLVKRDVFEPEQARRLRWHAQSEQLRVLAHDENGLQNYWRRLPTDDQLQPKVAAAAARSFLQLGAQQQAADVLAASLEKEWVPELVHLFGECAGADLVKQIERAEAWLRAHNQDAVLLLVLGTLCIRAQLWGKAQTYLEASLAVETTHSAHLALGEMLGKLGKSAEANAHLAAALRLALARLESASGGRRKLVL